MIHIESIVMNFEIFILDSRN